MMSILVRKVKWLRTAGSSACISTNIWRVIYFHHSWPPTLLGSHPSNPPLPTHACLWIRSCVFRWTADLVLTIEPDWVWILQFTTLTFYEISKIIAYKILFDIFIFINILASSNIVWLLMQLRSILGYWFIFHLL